MAGKIAKKSFTGRSLNRQTLWESLGLILLGAVFIYLLVSGRYLNFVVPKLRPYLLGTGLVLLLLGGFHLRSVFIPTYRPRVRSAWLLLGPALLFLCLRPVGLSGSHQADGFGAKIPGSAPDFLTGGEVDPAAGKVGTGRLALDPAVQATASDRTAATSIAPGAGDIPPELQAFLQEQKTHPNRTDSSVSDLAGQTVPEDKRSLLPQKKQGHPGAEPGTYISTAMTATEQTLHGYDASARHIEISDQEFYAWLCEIFLNPHDFYGYTITLNAQVFINDQVSQGQEFLASRLLMTCCTADLVPTGIIAKMPDGSLPEQDSWLRLTGTLAEMTFASRKVPALQVTASEPGEAPAERYVYPYPM